MPAPEPMLSSLGTRWPTSDDWVLQVKWDGFRLLVEIPRRGAVRAWSRHGASLTERLPNMLDPFRAMPPGTIIDGELVAIAERDGRPVQDFAAVRRAVFNGDREAAARLMFIAFDLLSLGNEDLRSRPWVERDEHLRAVLPVCEIVRLADSQPATHAAHDAIVALGFEGTVLKRRRSTYRAGRQSAWQKHKARHQADGLLVALHEDREGRPWGICETERGRGLAAANGVTAAAIGQPVQIIYSRTDADGSLREARIQGQPSNPHLPTTPSSAVA
jgi:bifunctional non-homologous end joining protein LigD